LPSRLRFAAGWHDAAFSVHEALDVAEAVLFAELMTFWRYSR
jgi:hypothetical protein